MLKNSGMILKIVALFIVFSLMISCQSLSTQTKADQINELILRYHDIGKFNGCILVAENGKIIYQKALGFADAEQKEKLTLNPAFRLASVSKQFTAAAVMLLQEQDKLNYEDDIREYLPELPYSGITIRHLLTHTSGLSSYLPLLDQYWDTTNTGKPARKVASNIDAYDLLLKHRPPVLFQPGERHEYCNTGYMLLALIVERVSGQRFQDFMKSNIFKPLGMIHTYVNEPSGILPEKQRAQGFKPNTKGSGFVADDFHYQNGMYGDGGIISSVKDLFKYDQALYGERLLQQSTLKDAFTPATLNDSSKTDYGFGWSIIPGEKGTIIAHGGGWLGFRAFFLRDIVSKNTVIQLCNMSGIHKGELAFAIYNILHGQPYKLPIKEAVTFQVDMRIPLQNRIFQPQKGDRLVLRGNFNDWSGIAQVLNDAERDSIYTITHEISGFIGDTVQYKFVIRKSDDTDIWEPHPDPDNPPDGNRRFVLSDQPQTLPLSIYQIDKYSFRFINRAVEFSVAELQEDFQQMQRLLEELHPSLYEYTDKEAFDSLFARQYALIDKPMQPHEFFRILTPLTERVGCGHTNLWMPGDFWNIDPGNLFPLQLRIMEGQVVVSGSYSGISQVPIGSVIVEINKRPVHEIITELKSGYSADAMNENFKISQVERRFPMLYARIYGFPNKYEITYLPPHQRTRFKTELTPANIKSVRAVVFKEPILKLELWEKRSAAILIINSFIYYDRVPMFRAFIDSCFNEIQEKNIQNLILDLRGNDGGDPFCAVPLFSYLERKAVPYFAERYGKYAEFADPIPRAEKAYSGNLFTLIDGRCFSTNGHFCSLLKYHRIGKFIGSETGATYTCNAAQKILNLKNTRLMFYVAHGTFRAAVEGMDKTRGIIPDYPVEPSMEDFIEGRDTILEFTLSLINNPGAKIL